VSKSTVSNVLRSVPGTNEATRAKVQRVIDSLGYRPNFIARQLVEQRSQLLGVIVGDLGNPFFAQLAAAVERAATDRGFSTIFCNTLGDADRELSAVRRLLQQQVAGVVFLSLDAGTARLEREAGGRVPAVFVSCRGDWADSICVNDMAAASLAVEHLIGLGHRRIAYVTTPDAEEQADADRVAGYRHALRQAGIRAQPVIRWAPPEPTALVGRRTRPLADILGKPGGVSAAFAVNDAIGIALLELADGLGIAVPQQLSIVGFDNISMSALSRISLTTIAQPLEEIATVALNQLIDRIQGATDGPRKLVEPPVTLIVRGSTAHSS